MHVATSALLIDKIFIWRKVIANEMQWGGDEKNDSRIGNGT